MVPCDHNSSSQTEGGGTGWPFGLRWGQIGSEEVAALVASCDQIFSVDTGHADLGAALTKDGELRPSVDPATGQGGVAVLEVNSKIPVHLPAPPFSLDLGLHLWEET